MVLRVPTYVIPSDSFEWNIFGLRLFGEELATILPLKDKAYAV